MEENIMKNPIRDLCLKIKSVFEEKPKLVERFVESNGEFAWRTVTDKKKLEDFKWYEANQKRKHKDYRETTLEEIRYLAGITKEITEKARSTAYSELLAKQIPIETRNILNDSKAFYEVQDLAQRRAAEELIKKEQAELKAEAMIRATEARRNEITKIEEGWKKYFSKLKAKKPTAKMFGTYLVKDNILTKEQCNAVRVTALFYGDNIFNSRQFHEELTRVRKLC